MLRSPHRPPVRDRFGATGFVAAPITAASICGCRRVAFPAKTTTRSFLRVKSAYQPLVGSDAAASASAIEPAAPSSSVSHSTNVQASGCPAVALAESSTRSTFRMRSPYRSLP
ncbi:hypothetical protein [Streptomyces sp. NPDC088350]|uniref:hypothetical protein n=1 Tax=Streptomyces sp. NPDC088350 TaxID=3365854 RepID=UPI003826410B